MSGSQGLLLFTATNPATAFAGESTCHKDATVVHGHTHTHTQMRQCRLRPLTKFISQTRTATVPTAIHQRVAKHSKEQTRNTKYLIKQNTGGTSVGFSN
eukprot:1297803-Amphidinium_carterae.1